MVDYSKLRVSALFRVINEQKQLNANENNVIKADFSRVAALAA